MCGRFAQQRPASELAERFAAEPLVDDPGPRYNVAPTDEALVVVERDDRRAIRAYRWGLIPHWATSASRGAKAINARLETVAASPLFRDSLRRRRCLVPVEAFYEWRRDGRTRQPFAIARVDDEPLVLAGLWAGWRRPEDGIVVRTFTIVTTAADGPIAALHDRMPVVLGDDAWGPWLRSSGDDAGEALAILRSMPSPDVELRPVSRLVNDVRNDGPELLARV